MLISVINSFCLLPLLGASCRVGVFGSTSSAGGWALGGPWLREGGGSERRNWESPWANTESQLASCPSLLSLSSSKGASRRNEKRLLRLP